MLNNVKISIKMLVMVLVPIAGMLIFAAKDISGKIANLQSLQTTRALTAFAVKSGSLIHELQKERGLSVGFISTKGEKFREDLSKQRSDTDSQINELKKFRDGNTGNLEVMKERLGAADLLLEKLSATRVGIDTLTLSPKESLNYYTRTITSYLDVVAQITIMSMNSEITRDAMAYHAFLNIKEQTGLERATLNTVFATNRFDDQTYEFYTGITASQKTFFDVFSKFANPYHLKTLQSKLDAPYHQQVEEMRSTALSRRLSGDFGIRPENWFATISVMINVMKEVEGMLAAHMAEKADTLADTARLGVALTAFSAALALVISLQFGFIVMIGIRTPLESMASVLKDMAVGDRNLTRRLDANRTDEIGDVGRCFNRFLDAIHDHIPDAGESPPER